MDKVHDFCESFFGLNRRQRQSFLLYMSKAQTEVLRNAITNVLLNASVTISSIDRVYLARYTQVLRLLASRRIRVSDKRAIIIKRAALITRVLKVVNTYIESRRALRNVESDNSSSESDEDEEGVEDAEEPMPGLPATVSSNPQPPAEIHGCPDERESAVGCESGPSSPDSWEVEPVVPGLPVVIPQSETEEEEVEEEAEVREEEGVEEGKVQRLEDVDQEEKVAQVA